MAAPTWLAHLKKWMRDHPKSDLKQAMKDASKHWKAKKGKGTRITKGPHKGELRYTTKKGGVRRTARKAFVKRK
jgi:hypothetical protein